MGTNEYNNSMGYFLWVGGVEMKYFTHFIKEMYHATVSISKVVIGFNRYFLLPHKGKFQ